MVCFKMTLISYRAELLLLFSLTLSLALSRAASGNGKTWDCTASTTEGEVDEIVARIMTFGRSDRRFPTTKAQFKSYCKEQLHLITRLEDYKTQCLKARSKQTVSIIIYSMKSTMNHYCKAPNSKRTADLISSASCANEATVEYNKCNLEYIDLLLAVEKSKDTKQQLIQLCCGYVEVFKCIRERAMTFPGCSDDSIETNVNYIKGFFDNASNLLCMDYTQDSDKCEKTKLLRRVKSNGKSKGKRAQSYFNPLVNLLSSL